MNPLWQPTPEIISRSNLTRFMRQARERYALELKDYWDLDRWSVENPEQFWSLVWDFCEIRGSRGDAVLINKDRMPGAQWFPDARLNFAENMLRRRDDAIALIFWGEDRVKRKITYRELYDTVSRISQALHKEGIKKGDRIAGFVPNMPEAIMMMIASASMGVIWSSCSPDFGVEGVVDRLGQIEPTILIAADGYYFNGKIQDCVAKLREIQQRLPILKKLIIIPYVSEKPDLSELKNTETFEDFIGPYLPNIIDFAKLPFDHPLYIVFSSGTTGIPKCIVHGAGGTLLQHLKEHMLHVDIHQGDRLFYQTTCGWMMWNWLVSALGCGATLLLYDGSPLYQGGTILFDYAEREQMTIFGTSAKFIETIAKNGLMPKQTHNLQHLSVVLSTGSPLLPEDFDYIYKHINPSVRVSSISGGTDIISCFLVGNPLLPVWRGELQCRGLGLKVAIYNEHGQQVHGEKGELVCTAPFPAMPIYFWQDPDGKKYKSAYFEKFSGAWQHGDYAEETSHHGFIIYGRSDATLNPGGVRIGTAEIYRLVEQLDEVVESIAVSQEWRNDVRIVLFVHLRDSLILNDVLVSRIKKYILKNATPNHVPAKIVQVSAIPRTKSGKIVELAVRDIIHGRTVKNIEAIANPEALEQFKNRVELLN
ncbi:MAG: acetoacetyl-CoA synthetase [Parcubacteria group bacterium Gr01-1014_66]|nr:MAG: acetoacetyl-CoA synthetase [Parcubacteria group bacterium Gr01-1014_66]